VEAIAFMMPEALRSRHCASGIALPALAETAAGKIVGEIAAARQ